MATVFPGYHSFFRHLFQHLVVACHLTAPFLFATHRYPALQPPGVLPLDPDWKLITAK
jgi:hypothetical protein